jgi:hypothetical protein
MKRVEATPRITRMRKEGPTRDIPGEGGVCRAPGPDPTERSASRYADAMSGHGGTAKRSD